MDLQKVSDVKLQLMKCEIIDYLNGLADYYKSIDENVLMQQDFLDANNMYSKLKKEILMREHTPKPTKPEWYM